MSDNVKNTDISGTNMNALYQIFADSNIVIIAWFLAVYFIVYLLLNIFRGRDGVRSSLSRWIDIVALLCVLIYLGFTYFDKSEDEKKQILSDLYSNFKTFLQSPLSLISITFFIFTLYIVIYILAIPMDSYGKPVTISIIENTAWILFVLVCISTFLQYVAGASLTKFMDNIGHTLHNKAAEVSNIRGNTISGGVSIVSTGNTKASSSVTVPVEFAEVFNISNNMFSYDDAQSVCSSYGARLATYDEIESTYNKGGEWCNYGWSDGQAAYFPTQKETWQKLQSSDKTKNSCGRPGVNGGYIEDPSLRFGVNCYGVKPKPSSSDLNAISSGMNNVPKTPEDIMLEKKVEFWKANRDKLLQVNSYNNKKWSMY